MYFFVVYVALLWKLQGAGCANRNIAVVTCPVKGSVCGMNEVCSGRCQYSCVDTQHDVWGSEIYTYDSSICRSATHDRRISTWDVSKRRFIYTRTAQYYKNYMSSVRFGIQTFNYEELWDKSLGSFIFLSPRVKEDILDVASLHRSFLFGPEMEHVQECYRADSAGSRGMTFNTFLPDKYTSYSDSKISNLDDGVKAVMTWSNVKEKFESGGFQCLPDKSMLSIITSIAMPSDAVFLPSRLTYTANAADTVTLVMTENAKITSCKTTWKKDGKPIPEYLVPLTNQKDTSLVLNAVQSGSQGIYSLECNSEPRRRGVVRLIVRECPANTYDHGCNQKCPKCENGGICHDITGVCVCPPGFNGTYCEHVCPYGHFGQKCSMPCPMDRDIQSCRGLLVCLPDPYGCSCATGYKGISCDQDCEPGEFGAGCSQKRVCHCLDGKPCNVHTGLCNSDCEYGWHGTGCSISYPVLKRSPDLINATKNTISVSIPQWNRTVDFGDGTPSSYKVYYMDKEDGKTWYELPELYNANQEITLYSLRPGRVYAVKVEVIDLTGQSQRNDLNLAEYSTLCEKPLEPPLDIKINTETDNVGISWKLPDKDSWNCQAVETIVKYRSKNFHEEKFLAVPYYSFPSKPFTQWNVTLCLRPENGSDDNNDITCTSSFNALTKQDAPGEVKMFSYTSVNPRTLLLTWEDPPEKNGILSHYILRYAQSGWVHYCTKPYNSANNLKRVESTNFTVWGLNPSSIYVFSLSAVTVKEGPAHNITCSTKTDVPSEGPTDLEITRGGIVTWNPPPCNVSNGDITGYGISVRGLSLWNMGNVRNVETTGRRIDLTVIPYTQYDVKAFARTEAGFGTSYSRRNFTTPEKEPPAPRNLTIYSRNTHSLSLAWLPPYPPYGELSKYIIRYGIQGSGSNVEVSLAVSLTKCTDDSLKDFHCYIVTKLTANQTYVVEVLAVNEGIESKGQPAHIKGETSESIPEPPESPVVSEKSDTTATISWKEPRITNGDITGYRLNVSVSESRSLSPNDWFRTSYTEIKPAPTKRHDFTRLFPATTYSVTIEACTEAGCGPPLVISFRTNISVPFVKREPQFLSKTQDSITIKIFPVPEHMGGPISAYFVVVKETSTRGRSKRQAPSFFESNKCKVRTYRNQYVAGRLNSVPPGGIHYTVGDGRCVNEYFNQRLKPDTYYQIGIAVLSKYKDEEKYSEIKYTSQDILVQSPPKSEVHEIVLGILIFLFILILIICVLIFLYLKYPHVLRMAKQKATQSLRLIPFRGRNDVPVSYSNTTLQDNDEEEEEDVIETESICEDPSCKIPVKELEDYTLNGIKNGEIRKQYRGIARGQRFSCHAAKIPANRMKNRYGNLLPFDRTRVKLKVLPDDPHSDYINANYVSGYKKEKKYIATQGPTPSTINNFWRMVWQENSSKILMTTNLIEGGRIKCDKYWPDESSTYASITVTLKHSEQLSDYIIRTFDISQSKKKREVKQFHFLTWPDHGVPMYTSPVVRFLKKVRDYQPNSQAPVIIHCSAGVGRTGTLILLDSMLEMGTAENLVDVCAHLSLMRQQRVNIVENLEQYIFVYKSLMQSLCWKETSILCSDLIPQIGTLRKSDPSACITPLKMEYQRLSKICPQLDNVSVRVAREPANISKNRTMKILPPERARPLLKYGRRTQEGYINAVYVNGYKEKDAFLVTQYPVPDTISDFWLMIRDTKSHTIVLLQQIDFTDPTCPQYWPSEGQVLTYDEFQVQCNGLESQGDINVWSLTILNSKDDSDNPTIPVKLFHHLNWEVEKNLPQHPTNILDLMDKTEKMQHQHGKHVITVQCLNGSAACGIFCATMFVCNKMINEQEVDVFAAVQNIRANRPHFIQNFEQYDFLYDMATAFLDNFGAYANFI